MVDRKEHTRDRHVDRVAALGACIAGGGSAMAHQNVAKNPWTSMFVWYSIGICEVEYLTGRDGGVASR
jgi:hypothetical protein